MTKPTRAFVRRETSQRELSGFAAYGRLLGSLPLFLWLLPVSFACILLSSVAPSFFRWYAGSLAGAPGGVVAASQVTVPGLEWRIPLGAAWPLGLALAATLTRIAAWASFELSGMWSAQKLHTRMVARLGRTRTTYFDENPSGRLINRLVRDYDEVRSTAIIFVGDVLNAATEVLSVTALALLVSPWAASAIVPLLALFVYAHWHRSAVIDHARGLAAVAVSRVFDRKNDLVEGREIFLLYGKAERLLKRMAESYATYLRASSLTLLLETWTGFWIRASAEVFSLVSLLFLILLLGQGKIDATLAGVIISALFGIRGSIHWLDHATAQLARSIPHIRRVFEITELPREEKEERSGAALVLAAEPAAATPPGEIRFVDYAMSYRPDTPVILADLNLTIPGGTRTALIGRTGSGKTSLVQALFRMVHVRSGDIIMGGRSIFDDDIQQIRARFGVVPQFPYLFAGDLRSNLDRAGNLGDASLQRALEAVGLRFSLDQPVLEGGQNFSVGERQLLCLARIIAADRQCIVMDEPTSGLDPETDARIHRALRTALKGKTVITIAHRRESLGHYDQVVELSQGRVVWQGTPAELFARADT